MTKMSSAQVVCLTCTICKQTYNIETSDKSHYTDEKRKTYVCLNCKADPIAGRALAKVNKPTTKTDTNLPKRGISKSELIRRELLKGGTTKEIAQSVAKECNESWKKIRNQVKGVIRNIRKGSHVKWIKYHIVKQEGDYYQIMEVN